MNKYKQLGLNTIIVFLGNAGAKLIAILMLPLYTRWLTVEDYGTTDIINVYVTLLTSIVSCCIAESVFIFPKGQDKIKQKEFISSALYFITIAFIITFIIFTIVDIYTRLNKISNSFIDYIWYIYILLLIQILQSIFLNFCRSIDKMIIYGTSGIIVTIFTALFSFIFIPQLGVIGYINSLIFANICSVIYIILSSKIYKYIGIGHIHTNKCREMLKYSIPLIPNGIIWWIINAINRPIMENQLGLDEIGLFAVANKFPSIISMMFSVFITAWQVSVLDEYNKQGYSVFYNRIFKLIFIISSSFLLIITICSEFLTKLFTTTDYYIAWKYIPILTLCAIFTCFSSFIGSNFSAIKNSKYYFKSSIIGAFIALILNFVLIPKFGILGACIANLLSFLTVCITRLYYSNSIVKLKNIHLYISILIIDIIYIYLHYNSYSKLLLYSTLIIIIFIHYLSTKKEFNLIYEKYKSQKHEL